MSAFNSFSSPSQSSPDDSPLRKTRSLKEIYARIQALYTIDLVCFEDVAIKEESAITFNEDLQQLKENKTWKFLDLPERKKVVFIKLIFKTKFHANGIT